MRARTGSLSFDRTRGRWKVGVSTPEGRRETLGAYDTRREAEQILAAYLDVTEGDAALTVADWVAMWLDAREVAREIADIDSERSRLRQYIAPDPIGAVSLSALKRADVLAWVRRLRVMRKASRERGGAGARTGDALARQTVQNALNLLRGALAAAVDAGRAKANVAFDVRLRRERRTHEPWRALDPEQQRALLGACDEWQWPILAFAIATGLRAGELISLELADVSDTHLTVRYGGKGHATTKGGRAREVPLLPLATEAVARQRKLLAGPPPYRASGRWPNPSALLFPGAQGAHRSEAHVLTWQQSKRG